MLNTFKGWGSFTFLKALVRKTLGICPMVQIKRSSIPLRPFDPLPLTYFNFILPEHDSLQAAFWQSLVARFRRWTGFIHSKLRGRIVWLITCPHT